MYHKAKPFACKQVNFCYCPDFSLIRFFFSTILSLNTVCPYKQIKERASTSSDNSIVIRDLLKSMELRQLRTFSPGSAGCLVVPGACDQG